jgi:hypothetical protein
MADNPIIQSTYAERQGIATAGMPGNMRSYDSITRVVEAADGIGFGLAVGRGTTDKGAVLGGALTGFLGVSLKDPTQVVDIYPQYSNIGLYAAGPIWVQTDTGVDPGDPVYYNATTGKFASAGGAGRVGPVLGARWEKTSSAGIGFVVLPQYAPAGA